MILTECEQYYNSSKTICVRVNQQLDNSGIEADTRSGCAHLNSLEPLTEIFNWLQINKWWLGFMGYLVMLRAVLGCLVY